MARIFASFDLFLMLFCGHSSIFEMCCVLCAVFVVAVGTAAEAGCCFCNVLSLFFVWPAINLNAHTNTHNLTNHYFTSILFRLDTYSEYLQIVWVGKFISKNEMRRAKTI